MGEVVHAAALAPAAVATCCLVADTGRRRAAELAASVIMLVAMLDTATGSRILPVVAWSAILLLVGMALGIMGGRRSAGEAHDRRMTVHAALGSVVMAGVLALMMGSVSAAPDAASAHHSASPLALGIVVGACAVGYAIASFMAAGRGRWQARAQHIGMGASALVMGAAALL